MNLLKTISSIILGISDASDPINTVMVNAKHYPMNSQQNAATNKQTTACKPPLSSPAHTARRESSKR